MKKRIVILLIVVAANASGADKNEYYSIINEIYKSKDYTLGITVLEKAVAEYPAEPDFYSNLTYMYVNSGQWEKAYVIGGRAVNKFPQHHDVLDAYRCALIGYGWDCVNRNAFAQAHIFFKRAYDQYPEDKEVINGYGNILLKLKKVSDAVSILEAGYKKFPEYSYIRINLSWSFFALSDERLAAGKKDESWISLQKAFELGDKNDINLYTSYLYRLPRHERFQEGDDILYSIYKRFGKNDEIYKAGFWLYHSAADYHRTMKDYKNMIIDLKKLYLFATLKDVLYLNEMTFGHYAISRAYIEVFAAIEELCPYWRPFSGSERDSSYALLGFADKDLSKGMHFIYHHLYGHILYRENKIAEAHEELCKSYDELLKMPIAKKFNYQEIVTIPFPLKGRYVVANYDSKKYITHMGLSRYCYDIYGADEKGNQVRKGVGQEKSRLTDWYGFGAVIFSPVDGTVIEAIGGNPDDKPFPDVLGKGNYIDIESIDGKIFHFFHLQQGSIMVKKGDRVKAGMYIARLGNSSSYSPHLHFGVYSRDWLVTYPVYFTNYSIIENSKKIFVAKGQPGKNEANLELIEVE